MASGVPSTSYQFSFGPWNISTGADPFGPPVRRELEFARKIKAYKELGFDAVQFHDDDAVPDDYSAIDREKKAKEVKKLLDDHGLKAEICAPRHWEDAHGIDGPVTSNKPRGRVISRLMGSGMPTCSKVRNWLGMRRSTMPMQPRCLKMATRKR